MIEKKNRREKFYVITFIFTFFTMVLSATFLYFGMINNKKISTNIAYSGSLSINYVDGNIVNPKLIPISEPTFDSTDYVYKNNFIITSSGTVTQSISMNLEVNTNEFVGNDLKYAIYDNETETKLSSGSIEGTGLLTIIERIDFPQVGRKDYSLFIWLQESDTNQNINMDKNLTATIKIKSIPK